MPGPGVGEREFGFLGKQEIDELPRLCRTLRAVDGLNFEIAAGETLGLVGESGSGKSTTGRLLVGLLPTTRGSVKLFGHEIADGARAGAIDAVRHRVQFVFQDPQGSLDPRMRVEDPGPRGPAHRPGSRLFSLLAQACGRDDRELVVW